MTEKRKPAYDLTAFKAAFDHVDKLPATGAAVRTAVARGLWRAEIVATKETLEFGL